jgi:hypothetical protein
MTANDLDAGFPNVLIASTASDQNAHDRTPACAVAVAALVASEREYMSVEMRSSSGEQ